MSQEWADAAIAGDAKKIKALAASGSKPGKDSLGQTPLMIAALRGHAECVRALAPVSDLEAVGSHSGLTALGEAIRRKQKACADLLIELGANTNARNPDTGATLLMRAIQSREMDGVQRLLPFANANETDFDGRGALAWAAQEAPAAIDLLLAAGANPRAVDKKGQTPLMAAIKSGNEKAFRSLRAVSDLQARDLRGRSAFDHAAEARFALGLEALCDTAGVEQLRVALDNWREGGNRAPLPKTQAKWAREMALAQTQAVGALGAASRASSSTGAQGVSEPLSQAGQALADALMSAARAGDAKGIDELIQKGAKSRSDSAGYTPLIVAAIRGHAKCVKALLPVSDVEARCSLSGLTALGEAVRKGLKECVEILTPFSDLTAQDAERGRTLLMTAAKAGQAECVAALLPRSDPRAADNDGQTALIHAIRAGHEKTAALLLPVSDAAWADRSGRAALHHAAACGILSVVVELAREGELNARDNHGATPLIVAVSQGQSECARALLAGSDFEAKNNQGFTALALAADVESEEMVAMMAPRAPHGSASARQALKIALAEKKPRLADLLIQAATEDEVRKAVKKFGKKEIPAAFARLEALSLRAALSAPLGGKGRGRIAAAEGAEGAAETVEAQKSAPPKKPRSL